MAFSSEGPFLCHPIFEFLWWSLLWRGSTPLFEQFWISFTKGWFVPSLIEIGLLFWRGFSKKCSVYIYSSFCCYLTLDRDIALHLNNFESPFPNDDLCQIWLNLAQWFQKRSCKCESLQTDDRCYRIRPLPPSHRKISPRKSGFSAWRKAQSRARIYPEPSFSLQKVWLEWVFPWQSHSRLSLSLSKLFLE
jgi:hypothetical protein